MYILLLFGAQFLLGLLTTLLSKRFQQGLKLDGINLLWYNLLNALFACFNFLVAAGFQVQMNGITMVFSVGYGLLVIFSMSLHMIGLNYLTIPLYSVLSVSGSLVTSSLFGFLYLKEPVTVLKCIALVIVLAAALLPWAGKLELLQDKKENSTARTAVSLILFFSSGLPSIVNKLYAVTPGVLEANQFFLMTNVVIAAVCAIAVLIFARRQKLRPSLVLRLLPPRQVVNIGVVGLASNIAAILTMALLTVVPLITYNITSSCISMCSGVLLSLCFFREKVGKKQLWAAVLVMLATALNAL